MSEAKETIRIFLDKFSPFGISSNVIISAEALGYIEATLSYFPWLEKDFAQYKKLCEDTLYDKPIIDPYGWNEARALYVLTVEEALSVLDDGTTNGFEFKIENSKIYYRERKPPKMIDEQ